MLKYLNVLGIQLCRALRQPRDAQMIRQAHHCQCQQHPARQGGPRQGRSASPECPLAQVQGRGSPLHQGVDGAIDSLVAERLPCMSKLSLPCHRRQLLRQDLGGLRTGDQT
ncbi:hypothetical protein D9M71_686410 [compost metagenome]